MKKQQNISDDFLRDTALIQSRGSYGWRRHPLGDLLGRATAFVAWLKPFQDANYQEWKWAERALKLAVEDSRFDRGQRKARAYDTRTVLRRAEAYRVFLGGAA